MSRPKPAAMPVNTPKRRPRPTASSPHVTRKEKSPSADRTAFSRNQAYQPWTAGLAPEDFASAPATNPASALPLVPQVGDVTFSHPARAHSAPVAMRTTNQTVAAPVDPR